MKLLLIISTLLIGFASGSAHAGKCTAKSSINPNGGVGFAVSTSDSRAFLDFCLEQMRIELLTQLVDESNARISGADRGNITAYPDIKKSEFERCSYEVSNGAALTAKMAKYLTQRRGYNPIGILQEDYQNLLKESREVVRITCEFEGS